MAPKLFTRHPKGAEEQDASSEGAGEAEEFFSSQLKLRERPPIDGTPLEAPMIPAARPREPVDPGWYPDTTQPGRMLYWDGFHFTGQSMQVETKMTERQPVPPTSSDDAGTALISGLAQFGQSAAAGAPTAMVAPDDLGILPTFGRSGVDGPAPVEPAVVQASASVPVQAPAHPVVTVRQPATPIATERDEMTVHESAVVSEVEPHVERMATTAVRPEAAASPVASGKTDEVDTWAEETERAVCRAREAGTAEAWQEAAKVAAVVAEIARTFQAKAEATQAAEEVAEAARQAERKAKQAADAATEADRKVEDAIKAAQKAVAEAKAAEMAAAEAKRGAEHAAQASPRLAEAAETAAKTAADAQRKAEGVDQIVSKARSTNTPEAWQEARKLVAMAMAMQSREEAGATAEDPPDAWTV